MIHSLRLIALLFVVTLVALGMTVSAGNASMDLKCDVMLTAASVGTPGEHGEHSGSGSSDHAHQKPAPVENHVHDEATSFDGHGSHCKAHACPATAFLSSCSVAQPFLISQTLYAVRVALLAELTAFEGPRRPPRA